MRSLVLQLLAAVSSIPSLVVHANPTVHPRQSLTYGGYAFLYFTGNSIEGEKIHIAASVGNNALQWTELNGGKPILSSKFGTKGLRDPFIIRAKEGNKFFLLATDLSIGSGTSWGESVRTGSLYLEIWESNDLITWSEQRHVLVSPPTAGNTWAPEAYYDDEIQAYVVFWASSLYNENDPKHTGSSYHRMMYSTTKDFKTFTAAKIWQDAGTARIDSTVIKSDGTYYRFTKDEGAVTGCSDIIQESSKTLLNQLNGWTTITSCIGKKAGTKAIEGPTAFRANPGDKNGDKFYLFVDEYGGRGYIPLETANIASPNWKVSQNYNLPTSPRHGAVTSLTTAELTRLTTALKKRDEHQLVKRSTLIAGLYADPNIALFGCNYYIYATTDGFTGWSGNQFFVWQSSNLVDWTRSAKPILTLNGTSGNVPWATGNAWAPTIATRNGKYYFYFSGQNPAYDRKTIGAAVSDSPNGPFVAQPKAFILNNEALTTSQAIDPQAFYDPVSGKYLFYWGNGKGPLMAELADDMVSLKAGTIRSVVGLTNFREGIFLVYRKGVYHMTYSEDDTRSENYRVGYATGTTPMGPWTYRGVSLQKDPTKGILGTGHNSIMQVPGSDDWYIAYHRFAITPSDGIPGNGTRRETTIDKLEFDDKGFIKPVVPTLNGPPARRICPSY